jgi:hypothetical protein
MKYTKPWTAESEVATDPWHSWLITNAHSGLEYNLVFWEDHIEVEFYDTDRADEFALEFGL